MHCDQQVVDIIIPNYNGLKVLVPCLESIARQTYPFINVIVVDNGSSDGTVNFLRENFPKIQVIVYEKNLGFSAAVNAGIKAGSGPLIFLLNNDTELAPDCLQHLVDASCKLGNQFFAAKMLDFYERDTLDGAGDGMLRGGVGYKLGMLQADDPLYWKNGSVFGACAGAALYRRTFFERVGLFDEDFFAYLEDVDLNLRANRMGMECYFVSDARVFHIGCATSGATINPLTVRLATRNNINLLIKNYPLSLWLRFLIPICIYQAFWLRIVLRHKQWRSWAGGMFEALRMLPLMWGKRLEIRAGGELSDRAFGDRILASERRVIDSILRYKREAGNRCVALRLYKTLFL